MTPRIAFIGLGNIGHRMVTNMRAHGGFALAGGRDPSPAARDHSKAAFPGPPLVGSAAEAIGGPRCEAVYIACPSGAHAEQARVESPSITDHAAMFDRMEVSHGESWPRSADTRTGVGGIRVVRSGGTEYRVQVGKWANETTSIEYEV